MAPNSEKNTKVKTASPKANPRLWASKERPFGVESSDVLRDIKRVAITFEAND
jgi:hypothetical protein